MLCLHGKPAVALGKKSTFWTCSEGSLCFTCSEEEKPLYDKAIKAFLATKQDRPKCCGIVHPDKASYISRYWGKYLKYKTYTSNDTVDEKPPKRYNPYTYLGEFVSAADAKRRYAKFRVYTGKERRKWWSASEKDIGRPFFVCEKGTERDPQGCGYFEWGDKNIVTRPLCHHGKICRVDGERAGRPFFGCGAKDCRCGYLEWIDPPNEDPTSEKKVEKVVTSEQRGKEETHDLVIKVTDS